MTIPLKGVRKSRQIELAASSKLQMVDPTQCLDCTENHPNYFTVMRQTNIPAMVKLPTPEEMQALQALERMGEQLDKNFAVEFLRGSNFYNDTAATGGPTKISSSSSDKNLPSSAVATLKLWFLAHQHDPYPTKEEKDRLMQETGLSHVQLKNWFSNIRKRHWHPIRSGSRRPRSHVEYILMMGSARQPPVPLSRTQPLPLVAQITPTSNINHSSRDDSSESAISSPMRKYQRMIEDYNEDDDEMDGDSDE